MRKPLLLFTFTLIGLTNTFFAQNFDWAKQVGGTDNDESKAIVTDASGNIYITGSFASTADFDPGAGTTNLTAMNSFDAFVAKYNSQGALIWAKQLAGTGAVKGLDLAVDASGNVYATGAFEESADFDPSAGVATFTSNGTDDAYVVKLDASGNFVWAKVIGGSNYDSASKIILDGNGNLVIGGSFVSSVDFDPGAGTTMITSNGSADIFVLKLDPSGNFLTTFHLGAGSSEYISGLAVDPANNLYVTGDFSYTVDFNPNATTTTMASNGSSDVFVCKYDTDDYLIWARSVGSTDSEYPMDIALSSAGNVLVTGHFYNTCDLDPGAGVTEHIPTVGYGNTFVLCLNSNGDYLWSSNIGGTHFTEGMSLDLDSDDNVFVGGIFRGTVQLDVAHTSIGARDMFVLKLNSTGSFLSSYTMGGTSDDYLDGVHVDATNAVLTTGRFAQTVDFEPGSGTTNLTANGLYDVFMHKMGDPSSADITESVVSSNFVVYPNPAKNYITIQSNAQVAYARVTDLAGAEVLNVRNATSFSIEQLQSGVYFIQVMADGKLSTSKFIKE